MLKRIKIDELAIGTRYSAPVFFDDGQNMLLTQGSPITDYEITVLKRWKIPYILTSGEPLLPGANVKEAASSEANALLDAAEELEEITEVEELDEVEELEELGDSGELDIADTASNPIVINGTKIRQNEIINIPAENILKVYHDEKSMELYKAYTKIILEIDAVFNKFKTRQPVENTVFTLYAKSLRSLIKKDSSLCVGFILGTEVDQDNLAHSSVNTAILAILLCEVLHLSEKQINDIAIAALLHDIGMMKIPGNILNKSEGLTDVEKQVIAAHTAYGYKTVLNELLYTKEVAVSIMQHHERWDGKGHPDGIAGEEIDLGARIIAVADAFVAMITPKPYRDLMLGYQAMKNLLADNARAFDPSIIKVMIRSIGIYPIGSIVLMSDASLARVLKSSADAPMRPCIKILIDATGEVLSENGEIVDLREHKNLFIVRAIDPRSYRAK